MKPLHVILFASLVACVAPPPEPVHVDSLLISPANARVARGESLRFVATVQLSNGEVRDVTDETTWTVDDAFVGSTSTSPGEVRGLNMGRTQVRAQYAELMSTRPLDVVPPQFRALRLEPARPLVPMGLELPLRLFALASDGSEVEVTDEATWQVDAPALADVRAGRVTPRASGQVQLQITARNLALVAPLTITDAVIAMVRVEVAHTDLPVGLGQQLRAMATLTNQHTIDVTAVADWRSESPAIGVVDASGAFRALAPGAVRLTASSGGVTGSASVKVTDAVAVSLVAEANPRRVPVGLPTALSARVTMSDGVVRDVTTQVSWQVDAQRVALEGSVARGRQPGDAELTASLGSLSATARVEVLNAVLTSLVMAPPAHLPLGASWQPVVTAYWSDGTVSDVSSLVGWSIDDPAVASVSPSGLVTALQLGETRLRGVFGAHTVDALLRVSAAAVVELRVDPSSLRLVRGSSASLRPSLRFTDGSSFVAPAQSCAWSSSDVAVASVSADGRVTAQRLGAANVTVTCLGATRAVHVVVPDVAVTALVISPSHPSIPAGFGQHVAVEGQLSDGTSQDLTQSALWTTGAPSVAIVTDAVVSALRVGTTSLTARFDGVEASTTITVTPAVLSSLSVSPGIVRTRPGVDLTLVASGQFSDGSARVVTNDAQWNSSNSAVATVVGGVLRAHTIGQAQLTVTLAGRSAVVAVDVEAPSLVSITVSAPPSLPVGRSFALDLQGHLSDGSTVSLTSLAQWTSSAPAIASPVAGRLLAASAGTAVITAQVAGFTTSFTVAVTSATPAALVVESAANSMGRGEVVALTAWLYFTDGSRFDVSAEVSWQSQSPEVVSVAPSGAALGVSAGSGTVLARWQSLLATTTLVVTAPPSLVQLVVAGPSSLSVGQVVAFSATATWSDGSTSDVTAAAVWNSSDAAVLASSGGGGFVAMTSGGVSVTVTFEGQTESIEVSVD